MSRAKYDFILLALEDDRLYSAASIADLLLETENPGEDLERRRFLLKKALGNRAYENKFPKKGDGNLAGTGLIRVAGWRGARWKRTISTQRKKPSVTSLSGPSVRTNRLSRRLLALPVGLRVGLPLLLIGLISAGVWAVGPSKLAQGYEILRAKGPAAAYRYFSDTESGETLIGRGWAAFRTQRFDEATEIGRRLSSTENRFRGDGYYLLSQLEFFRGHSASSYQFLILAKQFYLKQNNRAALYLVFLGLARLDIDEGNIQNAEANLKKSLNYGIPTASYFRFQASLCFEKADFAGGLKWTQKLIDDFPGADDRSQAYISNALFHLLLGDLGSAQESIQKANIYIYEQNNEKHFIYNLINQYILSKYQKLELDYLVETIKDYQKRDPNPELEKLFSFAKGFHCDSDIIK